MELFVFPFAWRKSLFLRYFFMAHCHFAALAVFVGVSLVYAFGISWFSEFIWRDTNVVSVRVLKLYTIGIVPMLCMVELFGLYFFRVT